MHSVADNTSRGSAGPALTNKEEMRALGLTGGRARDSKKVAARGISGVVKRAPRDPQAKDVAKGVWCVAIAPSAHSRKATLMVGPNCRRKHERESPGEDVEELRRPQA